MWPGAYPQTSTPSSNEPGTPGSLYTVSVVPQMQRAQIYHPQAQAQAQNINGSPMGALKLRYEQGANLVQSSGTSSGYPQKGKNLQNLGTTTTRVVGTVSGSGSEGQSQHSIVPQPQLVYGKQYYTQPSLSTQFQGFSTTNAHIANNSYNTKQQQQQHLYGVSVQAQAPSPTGTYYNVMPVQAQQAQHPHSGIASRQEPIPISMYAPTQQDGIPTRIVQQSIQSTEALSPSQGHPALVAHIPTHLMAPYKNVVEEKIEKTIDTFGSRRPKRARRRRYGMTTGYGKASETPMAYIPVNPAHLFGQAQVQIAQQPNSKTKEIKKNATKSPKNKSKAKAKEEEIQTPSNSNSNPDKKSTDSNIKQVSTTESTSKTDTTTNTKIQKAKARDKDNKDEDKKAKEESTEKSIDENGILMSKRKRVPETTSKYRGVSWNKANKSWKACIKIKGRNIHIGYFGVETDAAKAYDIVSQQYRGAKARVNFPESRAAYAQTVGYYC